MGAVFSRRSAAETRRATRHSPSPTGRVEDDVVCAAESARCDDFGGEFGLRVAAALELGAVGVIGILVGGPDMGAAEMGGQCVDAGIVLDDIGADVLGDNADKLVKIGLTEVGGKK